MPSTLKTTGNPSAPRLGGGPDQVRNRPWSDGRAQYTYRDGAHEMRISLDQPDGPQVAAVRDGDVEFALVVEEPAILLCSRFGDVAPWVAAPFLKFGPLGDPGALPPAPHSPGESRALLHVTLAEAGSGRTLAERNVTLWLDFTRALHQAIHDRFRVPFHPVDHDRALVRLRRRYPTDDILAASSAIRCLGSL